MVTPTTDLTLGSPVNFIASAQPSGGNTINKWSIYVDGSDVYNAGATNSINTNVAIANGAHNVTVRTWDTSGLSGDQNLFLTVSPEPAVAVVTPVPNGNVNSPINVQASASPSKGNQITGWYVYLDGEPVYNTGAVTSINTNIQTSNGAHTLLIRAWDSSGAYGSQILIVQVNN